TPLAGGALPAAWADWWWLPALAALATIAGVRLAPRLLPRVPGPIAGLVLGTLVFHVLAMQHPGAPPAHWMIGAVPGFDGAGLTLAGAGFGALPWAVILPAAAALAVLAALDTLLTAVVADVATGARHDSRRELVGQGVGQVAAAAFGGMAGAGTTAATVIAIRSGGGRWVGVAAGLVFLLVTAYAGEAGTLLPVGALAGVILAVAIDVADRDILTWARDGRTRQDAAIAVLVTLITVLYDLMIAVAVGIAIAIALFIREQITAPVVHRRASAAETRSIRARSVRERALLDRHGARIVLYELRGNLFFGTADRLIDELARDLDGPNLVILHLRKVTRIDLTALRYLEQIANRLAAHGGTLVFCELHAGTGIAGPVAETLRRISHRGAAVPVLTFNGRDEALEFAENALLATLGLDVDAPAAGVPLEDNALMRMLDAAQRARLATLLREITVAAGTAVFRAGEESDQLYLVTRGRIEIRLATTAHHYKRLAVYVPGSFFGELALLKQGARAADAVATVASSCLVLERAVFEELEQHEPALAIALLRALCDSLVANQRWSTRELQRLSEW
ncbi:MAG: cyclic nucleotide-binding domain-containing protein, partial [Gammaproteobacteria bacterium]